MKTRSIKNGPVTGPQSSGKAGGAKKSSNSGVTQSSGGVKSKPAVNVSVNSGISSVLNADSEKRAEKIESLNAAYMSDNLETDSEQTAGKIIQDLTDYTLA